MKGGGPKNGDVNVALRRGLRPLAHFLLSKNDRHAHEGHGGRGEGDDQKRIRREQAWVLQRLFSSESALTSSRAETESYAQLPDALSWVQPQSCLTQAHQPSYKIVGAPEARKW